MGVCRRFHNRSGCSCMSHPPSPWLSFWRSLRSLVFSPDSPWVRPVPFAVTVPPPPPRPKSPPFKQPVSAISLIMPPTRPPIQCLIQVPPKTLTPTWPNISQAVEPFSQPCLAPTSTTYPLPASDTLNPNPPWLVARLAKTPILRTLGVTPTAITRMAQTLRLSGQPREQQMEPQTNG